MKVEDKRVILDMFRTIMSFMRLLVANTNGVISISERAAIDKLYVEVQKSFDKWLEL